jgi:hypothetical protein
MNFLEEEISLLPQFGSRVSCTNAIDLVPISRLSLPYD